MKAPHIPIPNGTKEKRNDGIAPFSLFSPATPAITNPKPPKIMGRSGGAGTSVVIIPIIDMPQENADMGEESFLLSFSSLLLYSLFKGIPQ